MLLGSGLADRAGDPTGSEIVRRNTETGGGGKGSQPCRTKEKAEEWADQSSANGGQRTGNVF